MTDKSKITKSTGNVFADLGLAEPETALAKAELARRINEIILKKGLKQAEAATVLGVDQAKVSALSRGLLTGFSTDRLLRFLNALGRDVQIIISDKSTSRRQGHISVS
jgi:predicted XRE-type DNA-binding protein